MAGRKKRIFGSRIEFRSLAREPVNELGVVYLFGVLHDAFDFHVESIQSGFPDCIAHRKVKKNRWEEFRIEFEYNSKSFRQHRHDPEQVDVIVCWIHDWKDCPEEIEVIELSTIIKQLEGISKDVKKTKQLSAWNKFCQEMRLQGLSFSEIAVLWKGEKSLRKKGGEKRVKYGSVGKLTEYQEFSRKMRLEGKTFQEIAELWRTKKQVPKQ